MGRKQLTQLYKHLIFSKITESKTPRSLDLGVFHMVPGNYLLSHGQSALSSAWSRFTVLFGMGRGGSNSLLSPGIEGRLFVFNKQPNSRKQLGVTGSITALHISTKCAGYRIKPNGQLVSVSLTHYCASTPDLSTSWSSTTLYGG